MTPRIEHCHNLDNNTGDTTQSQTSNCANSVNFRPYLALPHPAYIPTQPQHAGESVAYQQIDYAAKSKDRIREGKPRRSKRYCGLDSQSELCCAILFLVAFLLFMVIGSIVWRYGLATVRKFVLGQENDAFD
jgi:hypothetical protein